MNADQLLKKYREGQCSGEELAILETWYNQPLSDPAKKLSDAEWSEDVAAILTRLDTATRPSFKKTSRYRILSACVILAFLCIGVYFGWRRSGNLKTTGYIAHDIRPGGNKAILTLANGKKIILTHARQGEIASENHTTIIKTADGRLLYTSAGGQVTQNMMNTMSTPKGGQYELTLSDGTKVILNAASSITYPTRFIGKERRVRLTGEAYFEVAHNKAMPFHVDTHSQDVEVLGTHFNINSYDDEPGTKTTLLEGRVRINGQISLKPGEQCLSANVQLLVSDADTELAVAWKNNKFMFENDNIHSIMRMVSRWYNVDVVYQGEVTDEEFGGSVSRFDNVSRVLSILQLTNNVHFRIEGRRIIVTK